jgi:hypothetical protein
VGGDGGAHNRIVVKASPAFNPKKAWDWAGCVAHMLTCLPNKSEALTSDFGSAKKKLKINWT